MGSIQLDEETRVAGPGRVFLSLFAGRVVFQVLTGLVGAGSGILVARWLGPGAKGATALILLLAYLGSTIGSFGLGEAAPYVCRNLGYKLSELHSLFRIVVAVEAGIVIATLNLYLYFRSSQQLWGYTFGAMLCANAACLFISKLYVLLIKGLLLTDERFGTVMVVEALDTALPFLLLLILTNLFDRTVAVVLGAWVCGSLVVSAYAYNRSGLYSGKQDDQRRLRDVLRVCAGYGLKTQQVTIAGMVILRSDYFLVGSFLGVSALGVYSVANAVAEIVFKIPDAACWLLNPKVPRMSQAEATRQTDRFVALSMGLTLGASAATAILAPWLLPAVAGERFRTAIPVTQLLMIGVPLSVLPKVLGAYMIGRGRATSVTASTWAGAAVMITLDLILLPRWGLSGAAIGASCGYITMGVCTLLSYERISPGNALTSFIKRHWHGNVGKEAA